MAKTSIVNMSISVVEMSFKLNEVKGNNFKLNPLYTKSIIKKTEGSYSIDLTFSVKKTEENNFPMDIFVKVNGVFTFKDILQESDVDEFMNIEAVRILYPYLRSAITNLTTAALVNPLILPIADAAKLFDNNNQDNAIDSVIQ